VEKLQINDAPHTKSKSFTLRHRLWPRLPAAALLVPPMVEAAPDIPPEIVVACNAPEPI